MIKLTENRPFKSIAFLPLVIMLMPNCQNYRPDIVENYKSGEIIIDLVLDSDPTKIITEFKKYNLAVSRVLSPSLNIVLFNFDSNKIEMNKLIKKVKKSQYVENAQTNKTIQNRR